MNIFWREMKSNYKALLGWIVGILFLQVSGYSKFEGFKSAEGTSSLNSVTNSFPRALQVLFGMNDLNIGTLIGYFGILYLYFALIGAIYSGLLGAGIVSKEERDKTSEFLYTRPITRYRALSAKIVAGLCNVLIIFLVIAVSSVVAVGMTNGGNYNLTSQIMNLMWGILLIQILFFSLGIFFAGICKKPKLPTVLVTIAIVASYLFSIVADLARDFSWLRYLTPLQWFSAQKIINTGWVGFTYIMVSVFISVVLIGLGYIFYSRRDLAT
ncbi:ABC transporter permease subunit [Candidatus Saccharibacteria bacterium]|nr:ABC transporter permease subunit [Candidatus Saccharibacteria bacterium]